VLIFLPPRNLHFLCHPISLFICHAAARDGGFQTKRAQQALESNGIHLVTRNGHANFLLSGFDGNHVRNVSVIGNGRKILLRLLKTTMGKSFALFMLPASAWAIAHSLPRLRRVKFRRSLGNRFWGVFSRVPVLDLAAYAIVVHAVGVVRGVCGGMNSALQLVASRVPHCLRCRARSTSCEEILRISFISSGVGSWPFSRVIFWARPSSMSRMAR
jgi:hypothetical protein